MKEVPSTALDDHNIVLRGYEQLNHSRAVAPETKNATSTSTPCVAVSPTSGPLQGASPCASPWHAFAALLNMASGHFRKGRNLLSPEEEEAGPLTGDRCDACVSHVN